MKNLLQRLSIGLAVIAMLAAPIAVLNTGTLSAVDPKSAICQGVQGAGGTNCNTADGGNQLNNFIRSIINVLLFVVGAVAVIMIIIGGLRYVLSGGDSNSINAAKNTILYAVIGLIVAILAYAIVNFVVNAL